MNDKYLWMVHAKWHQSDVQVDDNTKKKWK